MYSAEPLPHFVDEYLAYLHEVHPTSATFDGVHLHDDLLEDYGRQAVDGQIRDLCALARRLVSKLRQVPRLVQAARDNIKDPPGIFVKVGLESMRGTQRFIDEDLPRAFSRLDDLHILADLADASTEASAAIGAYAEYLEKDLAPRSKGSFRLGRERCEEKLRLDEGLTIDADRLLTIALRELATTQQEFRRVAAKINGKDPDAAWEKAKGDHPPPGQLVSTAQEQLGELVSFINKQ